MDDCKNSPASKKLNLLIVDDEPDMLHFARVFFVKGGYEVFTAESGLEALDLIRRHNIDMIITNIKMPGMDGMELLREVNKVKPQMIKIILSGGLTLDRIKEAIRLGCRAYIAKPIEIDELRATVNKVSVSPGIEGTILLSCLAD